MKKKHWNNIHKCVLLKMMWFLYPDLCVFPPQMDGLVRVNGEVTEDVPCSTPPTSALHSPSKVKDVPSEQKEEEVPSKQTEKDAPSEKISTNHEKVEHTPSRQREKPTSCLGSAISSLIGGRNCTTTTTIVTELTHTEPHQPDIHSNGQVISQVACLSI